jgi:hypothetical protein
MTVSRRVARVSRRIASEGSIILHRFRPLRVCMDRPAPLRARNHPVTHHTGRDRQSHAHTHIDALVLVLMLSQTRQTPSRGYHSGRHSPRRLRRLGSCK